MKYLFTVLVTLLVLVPTTHAAPALDKAVTSAGGAVMTGGNIQISGNIGDIIVGPTSQGTTEVWQGFWTPNMVPTVSVGNPAVPLTHFLAPLQPNPAHGSTTIQFGVPVEQLVSLRVYDVTGRLVRELVNSQLPAGVYHQSWDLRSNEGVRVPAGIYLSRLSTSTLAAVRKLVVLD